MSHAWNLKRPMVLSFGRELYPLGKFPTASVPLRPALVDRNALGILIKTVCPVTDH